MFLFRGNRKRYGLHEIKWQRCEAIGKHINNALKEELDNSTVSKFATVQMEGDCKIERNIEHYNLDMIIFCWLSCQIHTRSPIL